MSPPRRRKAEDESRDSADSFLQQAAQIVEPAWGETGALLPLEPGEVVGDRFRIGALTGSGGMGAVYRAEDLVAGGQAAVKILAVPSLSIRKRLLREAAVLAELSHPCVVRYIAHGTTSRDLPFLAMDWLEGEDLARRLARAPVAVGDALSIARRACQGLSAAHARGIVHRDVKPSNLFLVGGEPAATRVIDFGVARMEAGTGTLTRPGAFIGTAGYMAPEQAAEATDVDARADVYSLGCVLFECLTGRPPFVGRPAALLVKVLRETAPRASASRPDLSDAVDSLLARLLAKNREDRPRDAFELLRAIDDLGGKIVR
jgi:eukaryotic-like serine/threonine-protein kinase